MVVSFKELAMDAHAGEALGRFWAEVVGVGFEPDGQGGPGDVVGELEYQGISMCPVPEPKTVKHRVHLDIYARSIDDLTALGARVLVPAEESGFPWTVMADPEGGEFCAFLRDDIPTYRLHGIVVDCADPETTAGWWGEAFGVQPKEYGDGEAWSLERATPDPVLTFDFVPVPEPKTVKNRIHWDVRGRVAELEARGATRLWEMPHWTTLADPWGNEFCVFEE